MTPERIEEIKRWSKEFEQAPVSVVHELLAALEEAERPDIKTINRIKKLEADLQSALAVNQKYMYDIERINSNLAEAQQTIARAIQIYETADMETDFDNVLTGMYETLKGAQP